MERWMLPWFSCSLLDGNNLTLLMPAQEQTSEHTFSRLSTDTYAHYIYGCSFYTQAPAVGSGVATSMMVGAPVFEKQRLKWQMQLESAVEMVGVNLGGSGNICPPPPGFKGQFCAFLERSRRVLSGKLKKKKIRNRLF